MGFKCFDLSEHLKTPPCLRDQFTVVGREVDEVAARVQVREEGVEVGAIACVRGALVGHLGGDANDGRTCSHMKVKVNSGE